MIENEDLTKALEELQEVPPRDPAVVQQNRAAFLRQAEDLSHQSVSVSPFNRLMGRFTNGQPRLQFSTLTIGILLGIFLLTFSSGVYAARMSSPSQFLYPVKLWLEDGRMAFTSNPHEQLDLRIEYAEERLNEIGGFSGELTDPTLATTLLNFDEQYSAIQALSGEQELDDVQQERIGKIQAQYQSLHENDDEDENSSNGKDNHEDLEDQPIIIEPTSPNDPNENEPGDENNVTETPEDGDNEKAPNETESSDEDSPEETPEPDHDSEDKSDDGEKDKTPEPEKTPEKTEDSDN